MQSNTPGHMLRMSADGANKPGWISQAQETAHLVIFLVNL
jgi:hypothetical protein